LPTDKDKWTKVSLLQLESISAELNKVAGYQLEYQENVVGTSKGIDKIEHRPVFHQWRTSKRLVKEADIDLFDVTLDNEYLKMISDA
jgi:hypothetical protein